MSYNIKATSLFEKQAKRLVKKYPSLKRELLALADCIKLNPEYGTPLGKGLFKIRLAIQSKGQGKSGGARVITFVIVKDQTVYLLSMYDKSEQSTVNTSTLLKILKEENLI